MNIVRIIKNNFRFVDTITTKLLTLVLFITVIPLMVVANFTSGIINQSMIDGEKSELSFNIKLSKQKYQEKLNNISLLLSQSSKEYLDKYYYEYLSSGNKQLLSDKLSSFKEKSGLDFCLLVDKSGNVIASPDKFYVRNLKNSLSEFITQVYEGRMVTSSEILPDIKYLQNQKGGKPSQDLIIKSSGLSQVVGLPVIDKQKQVRAVLITGKLLVNDEEIPYLIKIMTGADLTIFQLIDDKPDIVTTNITFLDSIKETKKQMLESFARYVKFNNNNYIERIEQPFGIEIGQYELLKNSQGQTIGAIYVGIPEVKFTEPGDDNIKLISLISVISLIVSIGIAALFARTITNPILKLVSAAKSIASGYLQHRVQITGKDEISQLSATFNQMAENLWKQEQLKDNFVATLTHDLKVPMLAENQTINYLLKQAYGEITEEQRDVLELIRSTNNSSLEMVSTLLEVYRYDTGNANLLKTEFNIVKLVSDSIEQIQSLAQDKKMVISLSSNKDEIYIKADEREIKRVLHNLISNAITNGIHRGQIQCKVELIDNKEAIYNPRYDIEEYTTLKNPLNIANKVLVSIKDDGVGITREDIPELFKRFSLNKGRKPAGTGLGLYYSYQVITKHNGYIWAESAEGKGSTFRFTLPVQD